MSLARAGPRGLPDPRPARSNGRPLVYLDSAATGQKPRQVLDAIRLFYERSNANVHRSIHTLGEEATELYEAARDRVRAFLGARQREEIIFTRGTTEAINLVVHTWARRTLDAGDEILLSEMEHHSNLVPWMLLARERKLRLRHVPVTDEGHARPPGVRAPPHPADPARGAGPRLERARHHQPGRRDRRARPGGGRAGAAGRRPGGAAPSGRRGGARRGLLRLLGPQAARPHRHRRPLRPARGAGAARAVLRRQRDDSGGLARPRDRGTTSRGGSSRARRPSPEPSASARPSTTSRAWAARRCGSTTPSSCRRRSSASARSRTSSSTGPGILRSAPASSRSTSRASIPTTCPPRSTRKAWRCGRATTARSR